MHDSRQCLYGETFEKIFEFTIYHRSVGDLAIDDIGVYATESLDVRVRVATNFVKMMRKKIARNKSSYVDSPILILLAVLHRMVFTLLSRSSE